MFETIPYQGELAALMAAFLWAMSSVVYGLVGQQIPPLLLNLLKGVIAIAFLLLTLLLTGQLSPQIPLYGGILLLISGAIGIGLGDTAFFLALIRLGARRTLLFETLAPPMTAFLAFIFLGESLSAAAWCGIFLTILGVAWVISERTPETVIAGQLPIRGMVWALLAAIAQSTGAVLSRAALANSEIIPLWSSLLRLTAGIVIVLVLIAVRRFHSPQKAIKITWSFRLIGVVILTAFASTYLAIWLQQTSLKFAAAGVAQTLTSTSPLFVLPIAVVMGEKVSVRAILGVLVAVAGVGLLFSFP